MSNKKQVFIIGLNEANLELMQHTPEAADCEFHAALHAHEIRNVDQFQMKDLIDLCFERIEEVGNIDAIASFFDFPGTTIVPIIVEHYDLPGPSLESVMKCEHKYWSRLEQAKVIPSNIPIFKAFDPFDENAFQKLQMVPPFWIKPIKSFRSFLAYRINDEFQFSQDIRDVQEQIDFMVSPFLDLFKRYDLPHEFAHMKETCIAESSIAGGHQCTLEGYVYNDDVIGYGIVDSFRDQDRSSFSRYEYPSSLPQEVQFRMADISRRTIQQLGLNNSPFNIEFFYHPTSNEVYLLEINPRISQAHGNMFEKVHGTSHHSVMLNLALGQRPKTLDYNGEFFKASNFMLRVFQDGKVKAVPTEEQIQQLKTDIPGFDIKVHVKPGMELSDLQGQDSYSFELANIFIGGRDQRELLERYNQVLDGLNFDIDFYEVSELQSSMHE